LSPGLRPPSPPPPYTPAAMQHLLYTLQRQGCYVVVRISFPSLLQHCRPYSSITAGYSSSWLLHHLALSTPQLMDPPQSCPSSSHFPSFFVSVFSSCVPLSLTPLLLSPACHMCHVSLPQAAGRPPSPLHGPNPWPDQLPGFSAALKTYISHMQALGSALLRGIALGLQLPPETFEGELAGREGSYWVRGCFGRGQASTTCDAVCVLKWVQPPARCSTGQPCVRSRWGCKSPSTGRGDRGGVFGVQV